MGHSEEESSKPGGNNLQSIIFTVMIYRTHRDHPSLWSIKTHAYASHTCCEYCNYSAPVSLCRSRRRTADCHSSIFPAQQHPQAHRPHVSHQGDAVKKSLWQYCEAGQKVKRNKARNEAPGKAALPGASFQFPPE